MIGSFFPLKTPSVSRGTRKPKQLDKKYYDPLPLNQFLLILRHHKRKYKLCYIPGPNRTIGPNRKNSTFKTIILKSIL